MPADLYKDDNRLSSSIDISISTIKLPVKKRLTIIRWIDGDTCIIDPKWWLTKTMPLRLYGIQCAESKDKRSEAIKLHKEALKFSISYCKPTQQFEQLVWPDAHGRILGNATKIINKIKTNLVQELIKNGLGINYDGKGKAPLFPA